MANYKVVDADKLDSDLTSVADAIREQTGETDEIAFPEGFASAPAELVEAGRQKEWSDFWDAHQDYGNRTQYGYAFRNGWNSITLRPKYDMRPTGANSMFSGCEFSGDLVEYLSNLGITLDFTDCVEFRSFAQGTKITRFGVIDFTGTTDIANAFAWTSNIITIDKVIVDETTAAYTSTFSGCTMLQNLTIEGIIDKTIAFTHSKELTVESAKSVISCLKNFTGTGSENTTTVTFHADVWGRLDAEGNASPDGKTWREYITNTLSWNC